MCTAGPAVPQKFLAELRLAVCIQITTGLSSHKWPSTLCTKEHCLLCNKFQHSAKSSCTSAVKHHSSTVATNTLAQCDERHEPGHLKTDKYSESKVRVCKCTNRECVLAAHYICNSQVSAAAELLLPRCCKPRLQHATTLMASYWV